MKPPPRFRLLLSRAIVLAGLLAILAPQTQARDEVTIFAAASLTDAMTAAGAEFRKIKDTEVRFSFASSSTLARQIEAGAPAQIYASANSSWMDYLEDRGLIAAGSRIEPITNRLALIAPASARQDEIALDEDLDLAALLGAEGRLALGDPAHVPSGIYAKQALESLGLWPSVKDRLAPTDNVRAALALVARGEAPLGITYASDAGISEDVAILGIFPADSHPPIAYSFALVAGQDDPAARELFSFLTGEKALAVYRRFGFLRKE